MRSIGTHASVARIARVSTLATGCLILGLGFPRLASLGLTEPQLLLGVGIIFSLTLQCGILYVLLDSKKGSG